MATGSPVTVEQALWSAFTLAPDSTTKGVDHNPDPVDAAMSRFADGQDEAFAEVARSLKPRLHAFLLRLSGSAEFAEDLTQETFLCMHRGRGSFAHGRPVLPWAYAIARNCFVSYARTKKLNRRNFVDFSTIDIAAGPEHNAEARLAARQTAVTITTTLAAMPQANREAFVLLRYDGMSVADAAKITGVSEGALKLRAFRAYGLLKAALQAER